MALDPGKITSVTAPAVMKKLIGRGTIELVYSKGLNDPDWETNCQIVDLVTKRPILLSPMTVSIIKDIIKESLHSGGKKTDYNVLWVVLILLEALVKNCGFPIHKEVGSRDFISVLKKVAGRRIRRPKQVMKIRTARDVQKDRVQDKVLGLMQAWGPLHPQELKRWNDEFEALKRKGVRFPHPLPEDLSPFSDFERQKKLRDSKASIQIPSHLMQQLDETRETVTLLESILESLSPEEKRDLGSNDLASELLDNCIAKKKKLAEVLRDESRKEDEKVTSTLLLLHERLDRVIDFHDKLQKGLDVRLGGSTQQKNDDSAASEEPQIEFSDSEDSVDGSDYDMDFSQSSSSLFTPDRDPIDLLTPQQDLLPEPTAPPPDPDSVGMDFLSDLTHAYDASSQNQQQRTFRPQLEPPTDQGKFMEWLLSDSDYGGRNTNPTPVASPPVLYPPSPSPSTNTMDWLTQLSQADPRTPDPNSASPSTSSFNPFA